MRLLLSPRHHSLAIRILRRRSAQVVGRFSTGKTARVVEPSRNTEPGLVGYAEEEVRAGNTMLNEEGDLAKATQRDVA